jgi:F-type H+-transporting ATPase subunit b
MRRTFTVWLMLLLMGCVVQWSVASSALASDSAHPATEAGAEEHHETGAPLGFKADLGLWSLVTFVLFLIVLRALAWKPLIEGLDRREARLRQDIDDAEEARKKAEQMLAEHSEKLDAVQEEVSEIMASARKDADQSKSDILAEARREAENTKHRAVEEIEQARDDAMRQLFDHVAANVADATEQVLGRALDESDQDRLIQEALADLSNR